MLIAENPSGIFLTVIWRPWCTWLTHSTMVRWYVLAKRRCYQCRNINSHNVLLVMWCCNIISNFAIGETTVCKRQVMHPDTPPASSKINDLDLYNLYLLPLSRVPSCARPISHCVPLAWLPFDTFTACNLGSSRVTVVWLCETVRPAWGSCEYNQNRCTLGSWITLRGWGSCDQAY